jgi:hypothetical protein
LRSFDLSGTVQEQPFVFEQIQDENLYTRWESWTSHIQ